MRVSDAVGTFPIVFILPEDVNLTSGSPKYHRGFLDIYLSQFSHSYLRNLIEYQKILKQRNALLKRIKEGYKTGLDQLDIWDDNLVKSALTLMIARDNFIGEIMVWVRKLSSKLSDGLDDVIISYHPRIAIDDFHDVDNCLEFIKDGRQRDIRMGTSMLGPHRDTIEITIGDVPLREYGSLGQKKSAMIAMKLAAFEVLSVHRGERAILVLDEAFAEFDKYRTESLLGLLSGMGQVFLASASEEGVINYEGMKIFDVRDGTVTERAG